MLSNEGKVLFVTNDFGPRAGGIETFIIGLIERRAFASTIVYTSAQANSQEYDQMWQKKYGVKVIRDSSRILLPTLLTSVIAPAIAAGGTKLLVS